jgi:hypothetical protein
VSVAKKKPSQLKGWDTYAKEADRPPLALPLGDGETATIAFPRKAAVDKVSNPTLRVGSRKFACALLGDELGERLWTDAQDKPAGALERLLGDVMVEFGFWSRNPFDDDLDDSEGGEGGNSPDSSS